MYRSIPYSIPEYPICFPCYTPLIDPDGTDNPSFDSDNTSLGIIKVRPYTKDLARIENGHVVQNGFRSCEGMYIEAENLRKQLLSYARMSVAAATHILSTKKIRQFKDLIDVTGEVSKAAAPWPSV